MEFNLEGVYDLALQHLQGPPVVHHVVWGSIETLFIQIWPTYRDGVQP